MAPDKTDCGTDPGAYVLGELSGPERDAFRRHMLGCAACRAQVTELKRTIGLTALTPAPADPLPPARSTLKEQVRGQARARVRQAQAQAQAAQARAQAALEASSQSSAETSGAQPQAIARQPRRARAPLAKRPSTGVAALLAAVALTVGLSFVSAGSSTYQASVSWSPGGAILKVAGGKGELFVTGMPSAAPGEAYEVWLQRGTRPPSPTGARFEVDASGRADVEVPGDLSDVSRVLVSAEPAGSSRTLDRTPVLIATLNTSN